MRNRPGSENDQIGNIPIEHPTNVKEIRETSALLANFLLPHANAIRWRFGICAALAMALLAVVPQIHQRIARGGDWHGSYVSFDFDEVAYASYLNALISGRARLNDPYTGRDDSPFSPQPESVFSIQLLPPYALALPARALGLSAATSFIIVRAVAAAASTLALFWLLTLVTGDSLLAAAAAVIVLCLGGLAGEPHSAWRILTMRSSIETLPFLRRYVPALPFPFFFLLAAWVWQALNSSSLRGRLGRATLAGVTLVILIYSYFFLWTAAIAWVTVLTLLWLLARWAEWRRMLAVSAVIATCAVIALVPYSVWLTRRSGTMDSAQLLAHSRAFVFSLPVVLGLIVLLALAEVVLHGRLNWRDTSVLFAASFALLPVVVFNQQVVTGLLLQPVHYGRYIANYAALLAALMAVVLIWRGSLPSQKPSLARLFLYVACVVFSWSVIETVVRVRGINQINYERDDARRVGLRLAELAKYTPDRVDQAVVLSTSLSVADLLPNDAPQPVLWAPHLFVFSGSSEKENRERLYQQLYYSGMDEPTFSALADGDGYLPLVLFGWERLNHKPYVPPITIEEVQREARRYGEYRAAFGAAQAASPRLAYVVVTMPGVDLTRIDQWYERDAGERVGSFIIYRVRLRG